MKSEVGESDLLKRFAFTIAVLAVFRLGVHIPTPGVNVRALISIVDQNNTGLLRLLNLFSGGALANFSIFALGIMPYISSSIIMQLMTVVLPTLEQLQKEGGVGRQKINRITRGITVILALVQGYLLSTLLEGAGDTPAGPPVLDPGLSFRLLSMMVLATGTCFVMWLGEQITEKGLGNGTSLLIFAGIVANLPATLGNMISAYRDNQLSLLGIMGILIFCIIIVFLVTLIEQSYRKIPIHYARKVSSNSSAGVHVSHLPLKLNMAGVIPSIFASTLLAIPVSLAGFTSFKGHPLLSDLNQGRWLYHTLFAICVLFFCYVYISITFRPEDIAENLKRQNAYIPGIRPGSETLDALKQVVSRLTLAGAFYMNIIIFLPMILTSSFGQQFNFSGTSLLIVVGVALETIRQVSAHLTTQKYDYRILTSTPPNS